jgi:hypothetical protein
VGLHLGCLATCSSKPGSQIQLAELRGFSEVVAGLGREQ